MEHIHDTVINKYPSIVLKDYYDVIHELLEAISSLKGVKFDGEGAHEQLINYICREYKFKEASRLFLQELRTYRNRIFYEGFFVEVYYVERKKDIIEKIILKLNDLLRNVN